VEISSFTTAAAFITNFTTEGQEVKSPQPEKSKPPVKTEQRGRILGIGGVFFKSANRDQMRESPCTFLKTRDFGRTNEYLANGKEKPSLLLLVLSVD
jgi:hypothetical protein